jgi:hypothetical protein
LLNIHYKTLGDQATTLFSVFCGAIVVMMPIAILAFVINLKDKIHDTEVEAKYGSIYEGLHPGSTIKILCNFFFTIRRVILVSAAVMLSDYPAL